MELAEKCTYMCVSAVDFEKKITLENVEIANDKRLNAEIMEICGPRELEEKTPA